ETLAVRYREKSIAEVLAMSCAEALELFSNIPKIRRVLRTLCDVGLDYVQLGQSAPTLSGGEAQRVKLAAELARPDTGQTLYLLDEPTTGLHFDDLQKLLEVLHRLADLGNTVVLIEHNLDVIKSCDWMIDMGPEAGDGGGLVVAAGTPEHVVAWSQQSGKTSAGKKQSDGNRKPGKSKPEISETENGEPAEILTCHTGEALIETLQGDHYRERARFDPELWDVPTEADREIADVGASVS